MSDTQPVKQPLWREWFAVAIVLTLAAHFGAGRLPQETKVLIVFPVGISAGIGLVLGLLANHWQLADSRRIGWTVAILTAIGLSLNAFDAHCRLSALATAAHPAEIGLLAEFDAGIAGMLEKGELSEDVSNISATEIQSAITNQRQRLADRVADQEARTTFLGYFQFRIPRQWGRWSVPTAIGFWMGEVLLAALTAQYVARRLLSPR